MSGRAVWLSFGCSSCSVYMVAWLRRFYICCWLVLLVVVGWYMLSWLFCIIWFSGMVVAVWACTFTSPRNLTLFLSSLCPFTVKWMQTRLL